LSYLGNFVSLLDGARALCMDDNIGEAMTSGLRAKVEQ